MPTCEPEKGEQPCAQRDILDQFIEAIEDNDFPSKKILGRLWNCKDIMPGHIRQAVHDMTECGVIALAFPRSEPVTYAQAARRISEVLENEAIVEARQKTEAA